MLEKGGGRKEVYILRLWFGVGIGKVEGSRFGVNIAYRLRLA